MRRRLFIRERNSNVVRSTLFGLALLTPLCVVGGVETQRPVGEAATPGEYRFRASELPSTLKLGDQVLTIDERAFLAALPEVRVGIARREPRPYEIVGDDGEITGIQADLLAGLAQAFGLRLKPVVLPDLSAALTAVRERRVDLLMTLGVTAERLDYLEFTLGTAPQPGALFARTSDPGKPPTPLATSRFALEREISADDFVRRQYPDAAIVSVDTTDDALQAVAVGRADYYLGSLLVAVDALGRKPVPGIEVRQLMHYGTGHYHFGIRKDWAPLAGILNKGIAALRGSELPQWRAAVATLPSDLKYEPPMKLSVEETSVLLAHPVLRVGAVRGLKLLNDVDARRVHSGIAAEYTEHVARRLGVAVLIEPFDNIGAMLDALRAGSIDLVPFAAKTAQREREFGYSRPYLQMPFMIVARTDAPLYWDLPSLRGKRVALPPQHPVRELLAARYPEVTVVDANNDDDAMDRVVSGEVDAAIEVKLFANLRIQGDTEGALRSVASVAELPAEFHFAASRQAAALLPLIDRVLAEIDPTERQRMLNRWVAVDLKPVFAWRKYLPLIAVALSAVLLLIGATVWWVQRLSREVDARRLSDERLADIGATMPGLVFRYVVRAAGQVLSSFHTHGAAKFLGIALPHRVMLLDAIADRLPADQLEAARQAQRECSASGETFKFTARYAHPNGRQVWLHTEAVATPFQGKDTAWTGYVVDVSSERQLQDNLARAVEAKNLFVATASHELRAPTHTLSLALQRLASTRLAPDQAAALRTAQDAAGNLAQLVDDVLDLARIDAGRMTLQVQTTDLPALMHRVVDSFRDAAQAKQLALVLNRAPDLPRHAQVDPLRLRQILANLLSNAVKYTREGSVTLDVGSERGAGDPQGEQLYFAVTDTGAGIDPVRQERLFVPFATLDEIDPSTTGIASSGLGLVICRHLAELMGGSIELASQRGFGTVMRLRIPMPPLSDAAVAVAAPLVSGTVLLCDDDDVSRLLLAHLLMQHGHAVEEVDNGLAALQRWRRGGVAALITDLRMPGMSGAQLVRELRADEAGSSSRCAVVVCSGSLIDRAGGAAGPVDFDAFCAKPVDISLLIESLARLGVSRMPAAAPG